jgi:hypothetical protein
LEQGYRVDSEVDRKLEQVDWKAIGMALAAYAVGKARNFGWRTGNASDLARGLEPIDIAQRAMELVINRRRKWDPNRGEILPYLKGVVDSIMSHLADCEDNVRQVAFPEGEDGEELQDRTELDVPGYDYTGLLTQQIPTPERALRSRDARAEDERIERLFEAVADDAELTQLLDAIIETGETTAKPLAEHLKTTPADINNRLKRLRRRVIKQQEGEHTAARQPTRRM